MAIPTSRTHEAATITIENERCTGCGLCVEVCSDSSLTIRDGKAALGDSSIFGCIGCGHCMAICPQGAISVTGRFLSPADLQPLPGKSEAAGYPALYNLLLRRRAVREFKDQPVSPEMLQHIIAAVQNAPMGLPPSDVHLLVFDSGDKIRAFSREFCAYLQGMKWLVSGWCLALIRLFSGKDTHAFYRDFLRPLIFTYIEAAARGEDMVTYDAPAAIYFYGTPLCDGADPVIAATYAMLAAESLGLGTCLIGGIHPFLQNGPAARKFREKHGIRHASREGLILIFGHPRVAYHKGIRRNLAAIDYYR